MGYKNVRGYKNVTHAYAHAISESAYYKHKIKSRGARTVMWYVKPKLARSAKKFTK